MKITKFFYIKINKNKKVCRIKILFYFEHNNDNILFKERLNKYEIK